MRLHRGALGRFDNIDALRGYRRRSWLFRRLRGELIFGLGLVRQFSQVRGDVSLKGELQKRCRLTPFVIHLDREVEQKLLRIDSLLNHERFYFHSAELVGHFGRELELKTSLPKTHELAQRSFDVLAFFLRTNPLRVSGHLPDALHRRPGKGEKNPSIFDNDGASAGRARHSQITTLLREGDDLQHIDEWQILQLALESHEIFL